ncbi:MAG: DNA repair protein RecO [Verrucomicrobia bacterium]|nr:DNA repair protein RecO [Verrucomicrobiota bacterium]
MSEERSVGIILRTRRLTETSLIVHWFTPELGRIATVARGALRPKSPFRGKLDLYFECEFTCSLSRRSELHALREVMVRDYHSKLRTDLNCLNAAAYYAHLVEQTTETETPLPELYPLFGSTLREMGSVLPTLRTMAAFEARFLAEMGLAPNPETAGLSPGAVRLLRVMLEADTTPDEWPPSGGGEDLEVSRFLAGRLVDHFGRVPKSRVPLLEGFGK